VKAVPHAAEMTIMHLQKTRDRDPGLKTRRYWKSSASLIKVAESGYMAWPMKRT
jgi:hypothetical protein